MTAKEHVSVTGFYTDFADDLFVKVLKYTCSKLLPALSKYVMLLNMQSNCRVYQQDDVLADSGKQDDG